MSEIIAVGHSITHGFWDPKGGWVQRLRSDLDQRALKDEDFSSEVHNLGIGGDTTEELLERFDEEVERRIWPEYELVIIIQIGANDLQREEGELRVPPEKFGENLGKLIERAREFTDNVLLLGDGYTLIEGALPWAPEKKVSDERAEKYHEIRKKVAERMKVPYISIRKLWDKKGWSEYLEDGVHPNSEGHRQIYRIVREELETHKLL